MASAHDEQAASSPETGEGLDKLRKWLDEKIGQDVDW